MKKLTSIILIFAMAFSFGMPVFAANEKKVQLSTLSQTEIMSFLEEQGVEAPDFDANWGELAKRIVTQVEEKPNCTFAFGFTVYEEFAEDVQRVTNEYYGVDTSASVTNAQLRAVTYTLQDSTVYGS